MYMKYFTRWLAFNRASTTETEDSASSYRFVATLCGDDDRHILAWYNIAEAEKAS